jgi:hypothetical protein
LRSLGVRTVSLHGSAVVAGTFTIRRVIWSGGCIRSTSRTVASR